MKRQEYREDTCRGAECRKRCQGGKKGLRVRVNIINSFKIFIYGPVIWTISKEGKGKRKASNTSVIHHTAEYKVGNNEKQRKNRIIEE